VIRGRRPSMVSGLALALGLAGWLASCATTPTVASVRSLDRAGRAAFFCMGAPDADNRIVPLDACDGSIFADPSTFVGGSVDDLDPGTGHHLYALVTLETRGELAVVDLSSESSAVLDHDPAIPGENALPVGAMPVEVVASPKGVAAFVAAAEPGRPGLYALPSTLLRPCEADASACDRSPPTLASWPACRLPSPPGAMTLVHDGALEGTTVRATCDGDYDVTVPGEPKDGDLASEGLGRAKLLVTLPKEGRVVLVDAQQLLDAEPGRFDDCVIERTVSLRADVPALPAVEPIPSSPGCAGSEAPLTRPAGKYEPVPLGMAQAGNRIFLADGVAPLVHVLDVASPCDLQEIDPLLPTSAEDPSRVVRTSRLAVSEPTSAGTRFLYAIDFEDKSVMAFDVSDTTSARTPIQRANPEYDPLQPPDRVRFAAAPEDVAFVRRDVAPRSVNGVVPLGTACNPDPDAVVCSSTTETCDLGTAYRTSPEYDEGAGPFTLRGTFAAVALSSGKLALIDVEDYDAACRGPESPSVLAGCDAPAEGLLETSAEGSCNVVEPHLPRSGTFLASNDDIGRNLPGIQAFPILSKVDGTVVVDGPQLRATIPAAPGELSVAVGGDVLPIDRSTGAVLGEDGPSNTLRVNLEDPRVHAVAQDWAIVYRGALPGLEAQTGALALVAEGGSFDDVSARFCGVGVQSETMQRERLIALGRTEAEAVADALVLADRLHVDEPLPEQGSGYWSGAECSYQECRATFGEPETPTPARELRIVEAYEDRLVLAPLESASPDLADCCFPTLLSYAVRPGDEWIVTGSASGYDHAMRPDPQTGACRPACDPRLARLNGRVRAVSTDTPLKDGDPFAHAGVAFRFAIVLPTTDDPRATLEPDLAFRFTTQGPFTPLRVELTSDQRAAVQTQQLGFLPATDDLFLTDGGLEGLLLVPTNLLGDVRQYY
jgi:hypothetical protein